jgi:uncharacterized protein (TIGR02145 family)
MKKLIFPLFIIVFPFLLNAQKNVIPVTQTQMLGIQLPQGSKQDKRFISVTAASSLMTMSTEHKYSEFTPVEVYSIPVSSAARFDSEKIKGFLTVGGYTAKQDNGDAKLQWFTKDNNSWLVYFSQEANELNLYIGKSKTNQADALITSQPSLTAGRNPSQGANQNAAYKTPAYIPPLAGRQTGTTHQKTEDNNSRSIVNDLDGNQYNVMKIGEQFWLKENLRTTQYRDTTKIISGLSSQEWSKTKQGAYAVYDDKTGNMEKYGLLYNGYAAASEKLCPEGWHVATDADWKELEQFLGIPVAELERTGERGDIAGKLKTTDYWKSSSFQNNNSSGFSIVPAGSRLDNGEYTTLNQYGNFWTSTVYDDRYGLLYLWNHHVHYNTHAVGRIYTAANNGYSCRCVKDKPKQVTVKKK